MFKLRIKNYRGFLDEEFDFSRVNILIGENSAGKSSIFKFLLSLKQSLRSPNNTDYNLTLSGDDADLGNYYETIYNHETDRNLSFSFGFKKDYYDFFLKETFPNLKESDDPKELEKRKNETIDYLDGADEAETLLSFEVSNDLSKHKNITFSASNEAIGTVKFTFNAVSEQDRYIIGDNPKCDVVFESKYYNRTFNIKEVEYQKQAFLTIVLGNSLKDKIKEYSNLKPSEFDRIFWHIGFLLIGQNYTQMQLSRIEYINPLLHNIAERVYINNDKKQTREVKNVKDLIDFLDTNTNKELFEVKLINLLKEFGIAEGFTIKKEGVTKEFRVKINNLDNNIKDVGFGVSLQLPIFAQAIVSEEAKTIKYNGNQIFVGKTLLIEQPEVHLHPRLQAKFIETLLGIGNNNAYFIETHSEHIIRMLQLLVKTKKFNLKTDDVSIHYFKKEGKKMQKSVHTINSETGKLNPNFPKGFYDVSYDLAFELMD
jgi:predicted ATPase